MISRENFERLISEKTFRDEMVLFSINADSQVINEEHRGDLIPILMRSALNEYSFFDIGGRSFVYALSFDLFQLQSYRMRIAYFM